MRPALSRWARRLAAAVAVCLCAQAAPAWAEVKRYALLIGANKGRTNEVVLRYAESDIDTVAETLRQVGGYASERIVRLKGPSAERARTTLVDLGLQIQRDLRAGGEAVLLVFYSGHGDGQQLHLGSDDLSTDELAKLVRLSPAKLKLLMLDACKSGALTRVKGGRQVEPFQIGLTEELRNEGFAVITSSAAGEDAQESDALQSSVFTHHFMSALRGSGDSNRDGLVTLGEAYAYAYEQSLRTSLSTAAGSQHATFDYDLRGRADPVLADLRRRGDQAELVLPTPGEYLLTGTAPGTGYIEATAKASGTRLLLPAGTFRVQLRSKDRVFEADLSLRPGTSQTLDTGAMKAVPVVYLVRKGSRDLAMGPSVLGQVHGGLGAGFGPMWGAQAAFAIELPRITLMPRLGLGRGTPVALGQDVRSHELRELSLELSALYAFDFARFTFAPLVSVGGALLTQEIVTGSGCGAGGAEGCALTRRPKALVSSVGALVTVPLGQGFSLDGTVELVSYYLGRQANNDGVGGVSTRSGTLTYRTSLGLGYRF